MARTGSRARSRRRPPLPATSARRPRPSCARGSRPISARNRRRQRAALGGLDLAAVLAQRRRDERQAQRRVDLLLGLAGDDLAALDLGERVLVQRQPARKRAHAQLDVVPLRAGEVQQRGAELVRRDDAQIDLRAAARDDAGLGVAAAEHAIDDAHRQERLHHRARRLRRRRRCRRRRWSREKRRSDPQDDACVTPGTSRMRAPRCARPAAARPRWACARAAPAPRGAPATAPASPPTSRRSRLSVAQLRARPATRRRSSIDCTPSSARSRLTALGPSPWIRSSATTLGGCFCAQHLELGDLAASRAARGSSRRCSCRCPRSAAAPSPSAGRGRSPAPRCACAALS